MANKRPTLFKTSNSYAKKVLAVLLSTLLTALYPASAQTVSPTQIQSVLQTLGQTSPTQPAPPSTIQVQPATTPSTQTLAPATVAPASALLPTSRLELLYSQRAGQPLQQFGYDIFGVPNSVTVSQIGGVQDDYILGTGDQLSIVNRGHDNNSYVVPVDRDGRIIIPGYSPVQGSGRTFGEVRSDLQAQIAKDGLGTKSYITLASVRQVSVLVTGEVYAPGIRTLSGLNTALDALMLSGGVKKTGSLRSIILQRGSSRRRIDLYSIIAQGNASLIGNLTEGDRIIVPPLGNTVAITGQVKRPAIYELPGGAQAMSVKTLLTLAGGKEIAGKTNYSKIELMSDGRTQLVPVGPGSSVRNGEILSVDQAVAAVGGRVTLAGAVQLPSTVALSSAPTVHALIPGPGALLSTAYTPFGIIVHRDPGTNFHVAKPFSLKQIFEGLTDATLSSDDVVYIFTTDQVRALAAAATAQLQAAAQSANVPPSVLSGQTSAAAGPGATTSTTTPGQSTSSSPPPSGTSALAAASGVPSQGGAAPNSLLTSSGSSSLFGQAAGTLSSAAAPTVPNAATTSTSPVTQQNQNIDPRLLAAESQASPAAVALLQAQNVQGSANSLAPPAGFGAPVASTSPTDIAVSLGLTPASLINLASDYLVFVQGEVHDPGAYLAQSGTSLATMLGAAGGPALQADLSAVEVTSTDIDPLSGTSHTIRNAYKGLGEDFEKVALRPLDAVIVRQVFSDRESGTVTVAGQVRYPGTFDIMRDERLSSVLRRAGGMTDEGYAYGAVFTRVSAAQAEAEGNQREALQIQSGIAVAATNPTVTPGVLTYLQTLVQTLQHQPALGRITVTADPAILAVKPDLDPVMQPGDFIYIPKRPSTVAVSGEVLNSGSFQYKPELNVDDYIRLAGGTTDAAEDSETFIVYPDGTAQPASGSWFAFLNTAAVPPGSTIVVPRDPTPFNTMVFLTSLTQILSQVAVTAASLAVVGRN